ncbi:MAG: methyltransferase domain-containing protein, partial [Rhizobiaceae bacterium]
SRIRPYRAVPGGDSRQVIEHRCALVADTTAELAILNPYSYYEQTVGALRAVPGATFVPLADICTGKGRRIALRHDIDADIVTGIRCARTLAGAGIPGSFFLLHTSHYYGRHEQRDGEAVFVRHEGFESLLADLVATGAEVGIHNDALGVIMDHGCDGIAHFQGEIDWLRRQGADIRSSVAHNSAAVYGAENFEVFKGLAVGDRKLLRWRGRAVRLQQLDMAALGLEYEGNHPRLRERLDPKRLEAVAPYDNGDLLRDPDWQRAYFLEHPVFERGYDYDAWLIGTDAWVLAGAGEVSYPLSLAELVDTIAALPDDVGIVVSIHPIYVGEREVAARPVAVPGMPASETAGRVPAPVPSEFGFWWEKEESDLNWYDWMFHYRLGVHHAFMGWLRQREAVDGEFASVLEVGCGRGVFYPHAFAGRRYTGLEYSGRNARWLREHRQWPGHEYHQGDIAIWSAASKHDLVFSSGTIDNVPDMDAFLEGMVRNARRSIYLTAYRGWFPELDSHRMSYSAETGAYYNDISPAQVRRVLERLGCHGIVIEPLPTNRDQIPKETVIFARKSS